MSAVTARAPVVDRTRPGSGPHLETIATRKPERRSTIALLVLASLLLPVLAACTAVEARDDSRFPVELTDLRRFEPATLSVPVGSTVVWHGTGRLAHTATSAGPGSVPTGAEQWDSGALYPGEVWTRRFDVPGTYVIVCRYHEDDGMVGTINVEP